MELPPLVSGKMIRRYKRFFADIELAGDETVTAHCPNTGSMASCWRAGANVQISRATNPRRKLAWTLERVDMGEGWIGVHTGRVNPLIEEALALGRVNTLAGYGSIRAEVKYQSPRYAPGRLDFYLSDGGRQDAFVEIKNVTFYDGERLRFPDAVTERGRKHLDLLADIVRRGLRGVLLFALNRPEGRCFSPAPAIDPGYTRRLSEVRREGVELLAMRIRHTDQGMEIAETVEIDLDG